MVQNSRGPRTPAEAKRIAEALRINLHKRKSLAKLRKAVQKDAKSPQQ